MVFILKRTSAINESPLGKNPVGLSVATYEHKTSKMR